MGITILVHSDWDRRFDRTLFLAVIEPSVMNGDRISPAFLRALVRTWPSGMAERDAGRLNERADVAEWLAAIGFQDLADRAAAAEHIHHARRGKTKE